VAPIGLASCVAASDLAGCVAAFDLASCVAAFDLASCVAPFKPASCVAPFKNPTSCVAPFALAILRGSFCSRHPAWLLLLSPSCVAPFALAILRDSFIPPSCVAPFDLCTAGSLCARGLFGPPHPFRVASLSSSWLFCSSCLLNPNPTVLESLPKDGAYYAFCGNFRLWSYDI
jgi:hypothetical protein